MKVFEEAMRYQYDDLTPDSVVIDCGGFEGNFAKTINAKYGCHVMVFEPIFEFFGKVLLAVGNNPKIYVHHAAVGNSNRRENFGVKGDQTGVMCSGNRTENVAVADIATIVASILIGYQQIALLKLNIEGMEFEVMERILDTGLADRVVHFQVQAHNIIPDAESRWQRIMDRLAETHEVDYYAPWVWFGATLRK